MYAIYRKLSKLISTRYQNKISLISIASVLFALFFTMLVAYNSINNLGQSTSKEIKKGIKISNEEYMNNYMNITSDMIEAKINRFFEDQAIVANIYQNVIDNEQELQPLFHAMDDIPYFQDKLLFNGRWYQNLEGETSAVLVQRYLLNKDNSIRDDVKKEIQKSAFLDLIMPSVYKNGPKKLWMYYTGGINSSFERIIPWVNAGESVDKVYPWHTDKENWEAFNPGLVGNWTEKITKNNYYREHLSELAIVKPPAQDGGSDKIIMSLNYPLWNKERKEFKGSINIDVELNEIIKYTNDIKFSHTGFAFLSRANGNIFAVNQEGEKTLGLKSLMNSTTKDKNAVGYSAMNRFLKDSTHEQVTKIKPPIGNVITKNEITIDGKIYVVFQKNLKPLNTFSKDSGIYKEAWSLGFMVPKDEIYSSYNNIVSTIQNSKGDIIFKQIAVILIIIMFCVIAIHMVSKRMTANLKKLEFAAEQIKNGVYDVEIDVESEDEIGSLADAFRNMVVEIKSTVQQLIAQNEILKLEVNHRIEKEEEVKYLQEYDVVTGLLKQKSLVGRLKDYIDRGKTGFLIIVGIDNFRRINEALGHLAGDKVLNIVAERLTKNSTNNETVYKISGDEFVILIKDEEEFDAIIAKAEATVKLIKNQIRVDNKDIFITASLGISNYPSDATKVETIIKHAALALSRAKESGKNKYQFYDAEINRSTEKRLEMIEQLRKSIASNELELYYQPQLDCSTKELIGMEALLRWNSKLLGRVMPDEFITLAEETGLIQEIGDWVLLTACKQNKHWQDTTKNMLSVAVNVSSVQFNDSNFEERVLKILEITGLSPKFLELEVTESLFIKDIEKVGSILSRFRKQGIKISVDDFGTGYSCLSYIKNLPIDKLKIDRSFIKDIPQKDDGALSKIIIEMAKSLGLQVVAEGIETIYQEEFLNKRNCDIAQGYLYSKPLSVDDFSSFIKRGDIDC